MKSLVNNLVAFFSISAVLLTLTGCDSESAADNVVTVSPQNVSIAAGESVEFTASGGYEYQWSIEDNGTWGILSTLEGPSTVYTSLKDSDSNDVATIRTLTVSSFITGAGSPSNNNTQVYADLHTAEAYISHVVAADAAGEPLRISSKSISVSANDTFEFTASGGSGSYTWSLSSTAHGNISKTTGDKVVYIAGSVAVSAQVVLTVTAGTENEVAIITHNL